MTDKLDDAKVDAVEEVEEVVKTAQQNVIGPEFDIFEPFQMEVVVHLWELMTTEVIATRIQQLEVAVSQIQAALDKIEAGGAKGGEDWSVLDARMLEARRQLDHMSNHVVDGDLVFKAKTKGVTDIRINSKWNNCLERHVVVVDNVIERILPRSPI